MTSSPRVRGEGDRAKHGGGVLPANKNPSTTFGGPPPRQLPGRMFSSFIAIDWSGAKGGRHKGIAIAEAREDRPPRLKKVSASDDGQPPLV